MKKVKYFNAMALMTIATLAAIKPVQAGHSWDESHIRKSPETSKKEKFLVRAVNAKGREAQWELMATDCAKLSPNWNAASATEREKMLAQGSAFANKYKNTHDIIAGGYIGAFSVHWFHTYVPRGTLKLGDQVIVKTIPLSQSIAKECPGRVARSSVIVAIDKIVGHQEGSLLYAQGKFSQNIGKDGKPTSNSKPSGNNSSGFKSSFLD